MRLRLGRGTARLPVPRRSADCCRRERGVTRIESPPAEHVMTCLPCHNETPAPCRAVIRPLVLVAFIAAAMASCQGRASTVDEMSVTPSQWYAPLPHGGQVSDLTQWWDQFNDPL